MDKSNSKNEYRNPKQPSNFKHEYLNSLEFGTLDILLPVKLNRLFGIIAKLNGGGYEIQKMGRKNQNQYYS